MFINLTNQVIDGDWVADAPDDLAGEDPIDIKRIFDTVPYTLNEMVTELVETLNDALFNEDSASHSASLANGGFTTKTVTVTGAELGDFAVASLSVSSAGLIVTANVTAADTVTVCFMNHTGSPVYLGTFTLNVRVMKA